MYEQVGRKTPSIRYFMNLVSGLSLIITELSIVIFVQYLNKYHTSFYTVINDTNKTLKIDLFDSEHWYYIVMICA